MAPSRTQAHPTYKIASIPADGIGPEVISAGITVLKKLASTLGTFDLEFENFDWSSDTYKATGKYMPDDALTTLKKFDAILFGAVGAPGKTRTFPCNKKMLIEAIRCPGSYFPLGSPSSNLPTPPTIR
jgi:isocitrate/isopropylmalate dehydrogenase